jgi:hypothetical protein
MARPISIFAMLCVCGLGILGAHADEQLPLEIGDAARSGKASETDQARKPA